MLSKKIFWKLNIIDLLLLAIIVFSVCALIYKATWGGDEDYRTYEISYVCENVPIEIVSGLHEGEECSDYDTGSDLGILKRVEYTPIVDVEPVAAPTPESAEDNEDDSEETAPMPTANPTHARALIVTETDGVKAEHGVRVDQMVLLRALRLDLIVGDTVLDSYISEIK